MGPHKTVWNVFVYFGEVRNLNVVVIEVPNLLSSQAIYSVVSPSPCTRSRKKLKIYKAYLGSVIVARNMASGSGARPKTDKLVRYDKSEYELRKRLPAQMPRAPEHVYVNMKTDFQYQMLRAKEIIFKGSNEVHIHGLGAAINRAINIALQVYLVNNQ